MKALLPSTIWSRSAAETGGSHSIALWLLPGQSHRSSQLYCPSEIYLTKSQG